MNFPNYRTGREVAAFDGVTGFDRHAAALKMRQNGNLVRAMLNDDAISDKAIRVHHSYNSTLTNCTLAYNRGTNFGSGSSGGTLRNCIVYSNSAPSGTNYFSANLTYCCAMPLPAGAGNFATPQLFVDLPGGNLRLQSNSPCVAGLVQHFGQVWPEAEGPHPGREVSSGKAWAE